MKILHLFIDGPGGAHKDIIAAHSAEHDVDVLDLSEGSVSYETLVEAIFSHDKVVSWTGTGD